MMTFPYNAATQAWTPVSSHRAAATLQSGTVGESRRALQPALQWHCKPLRFPGQHHCNNNQSVSAGPCKNKLEPWLMNTWSSHRGGTAPSGGSGSSRGSLRSHQSAADKRANLNISSSAPVGPAPLCGSNSHGKAVNTEGVDLWESHCLSCALGALICSKNLFSSTETHTDLLTDLYFY